MSDPWVAERALGKIVVRPEYLDLTGDLVAGVLLSQIVYWFRPKSGGKGSASIQRDGRLWVAKTQEQWCAECRIGLWQFQQAMKRLKALEIVDTGTYKFAGRPVLHVALDVHKLMALVKPCPTDGAQAETDADHAETVQSGNPTIGKPDGPVSGNPTDNDVDSPPSLEEESTKESSNGIALAQAPTGEPMPTLKELMEVKTKAQHHLPSVWKASLSNAYGGFVKPLTAKDQGQFKHLRAYLESLGLDPGECVRWVINNWLVFTTDVKVLEGEQSVPSQPNIGWVLKYKHRLAECYKLAVQSIAQPVTLPAQGVVLTHKVDFTPVPEEQPAQFTPEDIAKTLEKF